MTKERDDALFWGVIGVIIVLSGSIWFGKETGWWTFNFPFWPTIFIWIGIAIVVTSIRTTRAARGEF